MFTLVHAHSHTHAHAHMHVSTHICECTMHSHMHVHTPTCAHIDTRVPTHMCILTHTCTLMRVHKSTHACAHVHAHALLLSHPHTHQSLIKRLSGTYLSCFQSNHPVITHVDTHPRALPAVHSPRAPHASSRPSLRLPVPGLRFRDREEMGAHVRWASARPPPRGSTAYAPVGKEGTEWQGGPCALPSGGSGLDALDCQ